MAGAVTRSLVLEIPIILHTHHFYRPNSKYFKPFLKESVDSKLVKRVLIIFSQCFNTLPFIGIQPICSQASQFRASVSQLISKRILEGYIT